jgi:hypothetical protein
MPVSADTVLLPKVALPTGPARVEPSVLIDSKTIGVDFVEISRADVHA